MASTRFHEYWLNIDSGQMDRYERMFRWNPATEHYYDAARLGEGQAVADFGCGPGHIAIEFARRVGRNGHVHALDINGEFIRRAATHAREQGLSDRITTHLLEGPGLPFRDQSLDRVIARNTIIYVPDPVETFREFRRVLKPGGLAHAIEGDWSLTAVQPVATEEWNALVSAASWAWPRPEIGRNLYNIARQAGFETVEVQVLTNPDTDGRLKGMIETVAEYASESGSMESGPIRSVLATVDKAIADRTYLAIVPQFVVTATA